MNTTLINKNTMRPILYTLLLMTLSFCKQKKDPHQHDHAAHQHEAKNHETHHDHGNHHEEVLTLSEEKIRALDLDIKPLKKSAFHQTVYAKGSLEIPPQNKADIHAMTDGYITKILVNEGDQVKKGQTLAYFKHPNIINLQGNALRQQEALIMLDKTYQRARALKEKNFGSASDLDRAKNAWQQAKTALAVSKGQLALMGIKFAKIVKSGIQTQVAIKSPIAGFIERIYIQIGTHVSPATSMFEVFDIDHLHVDLKVFQQDFKYLKIGQKMKIKLAAYPHQERVAKIYAIGKNVEDSAAALHIHAEFTSEDIRDLIPGMYVSAAIMTRSQEQQTISSSGLVQKEGQFYVFTAQKSHKTWTFKQHAVQILARDDHQVAFAFEKKPKGAVNIVHKNAYYLMAELGKHQTKHEH